MQEPIILSFTLQQLWLGLLALAGGIVSLSAAGSVIGKWIAKAKKPTEEIAALIKDLEAVNRTLAAITSKVDEIDAWRRKAESYLGADKDRLDKLDEGQRIMQQGLLALLDHGIDGNSTGQMNRAKEDLQNYLINH